MTTISRPGLVAIKNFIDRSFREEQRRAQEAGDHARSRGHVHLLNWLAEEGQAIDKALAVEGDVEYEITSEAVESE